MRNWRACGGQPGPHCNVASPCVVRRARVEDLDSILAIAASSSLASHWTREQYVPLLACPRDAAVQGVLLVGEVDGVVVGVAAASALLAVRPPEAELENLAVLPNAQRCGAGSALLEAVLAWAAEQGAGPVRLEVRSGNVAAITLYRRRGFVQIGLRRGYYTDPDDDAVCMEHA